MRAWSFLKPSTMLTCQKQHFSLSNEVTYLNCSYMSPTPKRVEAAGIAGLSKKNEPYLIGIPDFFDPVANLKRLFATLINVTDPESIAIIPSVSYGMASVVKNVKVRPGQNIVVVEEIFPSNFYPWKKLADETGGIVKTVSPPGTGQGRGAGWNERLLEAIDSQTVAVALPHAHWADGTRFDLAAVRKKTQEVGALMIIDGTQSVGAMPFDVQAFQPDALICAGYKWLLGPYSAGLAYFGPRFEGGEPVEENWINRLGSENFQNLVNYQPSYKPAANRYCMGENSQFIAVPMLTAALELLLEWGVENIQAYCSALSAPFVKAAGDLGCQVETDEYRMGHIFGIRLPEHASLEQFKALATEYRLFVSIRGNSVRVSPHVYNDANDFERLKGLLTEVCVG